MTTTVQEGSVVKVHYTGTLSDGTVFDSSVNSEPLQFKVGEGMVIKGFEEGVKGMKLNEEKTITIKSEDAYGPKQEALILKVPPKAFSNYENLKPGETYSMNTSDGQIIRVKVIDKNEESVTIDLNHPLAGEELTFNAKIIEIK